MRRKVLPVVLCGALTISVASPYATYANEEIDQKISEIEKQIDESKAKQSGVKKRIEGNKEKQEKEKRTLSQLEMDLEKTKAEIEALNDEIAKTETTLKKAKKELQIVKKRIAERNHLLQERIRLLYENGKVSYLEVLFKATDFADFLSRFEAIRAVSERDKELLEESREDRQIIAAHKEKIEQSLAHLDKLQDEAKNKRNLLAKQKKEHEMKLASLQKEQEQLETISEEEEQEVNALIERLARAEAEKEEWRQQEEERKRQEERKKKEMAKAQAKGNSNSQSSERQDRAPNSPSVPSSASVSASGFAWPVQGAPVGVISSPYGYRNHPIYGTKRLHAGIDISASLGTPILAAADGKVLEARPSSGYGNIVVIYHGNGISTKYAHMTYNSIKVRPGQTVKRGQHIASVGNEGASTAPHLHFEVLKWGTPINPMPFY